MTRPQAERIKARRGDLPNWTSRQRKQLYAAGHLKLRFKLRCNRAKARELVKLTWG